MSGSAALACVAATVAAAQSPAAGQPTPAAAPRLCHTWKHHGALASKLSTDIHTALSGRTSVVAVQVDDPSLGVACWFHARRHFFSASVVKATILAALMLKARSEQRGLTASEKSLAYQMITRSSIPAADALWADVGMASLQRFLDRARMTGTVLGQGGWWGLTQITAHDEIRFLWVLMRPNHVLTRAERRYELGLMAHVVRWQRWGVPAGAPARFRVHVKNGWVPSTPFGWLINSIAGFTRRHQDYAMVVLTHSNPTMRYGITTIECIAVRVSHDLHPGAKRAIGLSTPSPRWGRPDEVIPPWSAAGEAAAR